MIARQPLCLIRTILFFAALVVTMLCYAQTTAKSDIYLTPAQQQAIAQSVTKTVQSAPLTGTQHSSPIITKTPATSQPATKPKQTHANLVQKTSSTASSQSNNQSSTAITNASLPKTGPQRRLWNLQDADIRAVIAAISKETGKNFIIDPRVQGNITIVSSSPITSKEAYKVFLSALQVLGFAAVQSGSAIKIIPNANAKQLATPIATNATPGSGDEMVVRVIAVRNVVASQLVSILRPLMPEWSNVAAYAPSNTIILAGRANNINRLVKIIHSVDHTNTNEIELVPLHYASANKVVSLLNSILAADRAMGKTTNISLAADDQNNSILMSGDTAGRLRMRVLISRLDMPSSGSSGNTVVIHLNYLKAQELAPILAKIAHSAYINSGGGRKKADGNTNAITNVNVGSSGDDFNKKVSIEAEPNSNAIIISAPPAMMQTLKSVIRQLDVRPSQVLVEAIIAQVSDTVARQLGIQWGANNINGSSSAFTTTNTTPSGSSSGTIAGSITQGIGIIKSGDISMVISALSNNTSSDILSTPSIVVLNNKKAVISVGKSISIQNGSYASTGASDSSGNPYNTFSQQNVALSLTVTPQISPDNSVRLVIKQVNDSLENPNNPSTTPIINTSNIDTTVLVNSGSILVLGGLISHDNTVSRNKIPILGDIPIIGRIFQYDSRSVEKKNLMVFLRPIILNSNMDNKKITQMRYKYMRQQQLLRGDPQHMLSIHERPPILNPLTAPKTDIPSPFVSMTPYSQR